MVCCVVSGVLNTVFVKTPEEYDAVEIEMQSDILFILSCLCDGDMHRKVGHASYDRSPLRSKGMTQVMLGHMLSKSNFTNTQDNKAKKKKRVCDLFQELFGVQGIDMVLVWSVS